MISKIQEKRIKSLYSKKGRLKNNNFIIEGKRSLLTAIHNGVNIKNIVLNKSFTEKNKNLITYNKYKITVVDDKCFGQLSQVDSPSGILAEAAIPLHSKLNPDFPLVYLDQVSDPGNLGTIIRTCDWFGIKQIGISPNSVEFYNPKVVRSSMGSHFNMKYLGTPSSEDLNKFNLIGADFNKGKDINDISNPKNWALVMGSEASGISKTMNKKISSYVKIERFGKGESLNIGVAMGIVLHRFTN
ncbi:RNA methyltransferase [bacterium]|nr:MAG: RNA methyltransferase [bacterium]